MSMEVWDAYYEDGSPAGCDLVRGQVIPEGLFHIVSNIVVKHTDGDFLLMQRDYGKRIYPGMYEASVTGGAIKGESAEECALRELKEETGIDGKNLQFLYICTDRVSHVLFNIFLCTVDCKKEDVILQTVKLFHIVGWVRMNLSSLLKLTDILKRIRKINRYILTRFDELHPI
jgi:ADP-ribose pyrophosphatase